MKGHFPNVSVWNNNPFCDWLNLRWKPQLIAVCFSVSVTEYYIHGDSDCKTTALYCPDWLNTLARHYSDTETLTGSTWNCCLSNCFMSVLQVILWWSFFSTRLDSLFCSPVVGLLMLWALWNKWLVACSWQTFSSFCLLCTLGTLVRKGCWVFVYHNKSCCNLLVSITCWQCMVRLIVCHW